MCLPGRRLEALSQWVQHRLDFPSYVTPVLVGHSSGATLVYEILAQSPPNTFRGGISLGFCPTIRTGRPLCRGEAPARNLSAKWIVLQGAIDSSCPPSRVAALVRANRNADLVLLPGVGHGFGVKSRWLPRFRQAFHRLTHPAEPTLVTAAPEIRDLPLIELRARGRSPDLAVVISGDGGWASIDRQIGEALAAHDVPVVGLNSLRYFWKARTPDQAGADLTLILRHYLQAWNASRVLLVGYSRDADVLPFMVTRLPEDLRRRVKLVALLGLSPAAGFEFHFTDLLRSSDQGGYPTLPEVRRLRGLPLLCVYGTEERDSACRDLPAGFATTETVPGGHHFGGAYREVARRILQMAG